MKQVYVGMDLGSKHCAAVAVDSRGKMVDSEVFKTGERNMISFLERLKGSAWVMLEEGELASWVARTIRPHVEKVVV
jgi:predicted NBD/HSP70 family sugar kinase